MSQLGPPGDKSSCPGLQEGPLGPSTVALRSRHHWSAPKLKHFDLIACQRSAELFQNLAETPHAVGVEQSILFIQRPWL